MWPRQGLIGIWKSILYDSCVKHGEMGKTFFEKFNQNINLLLNRHSQHDFPRLKNNCKLLIRPTNKMQLALGLQDVGFFRCIKGRYD